MLFKITMPAPFGGIFVFPLVGGSALLYLLSLVIGSVVGAIILTIIKKPLKDIS